MIYYDPCMFHGVTSFLRKNGPRYFKAITSSMKYNCLYECIVFVPITDYKEEYSTLITWGKTRIEYIPKFILLPIDII